MKIKNKQNKINLPNLNLARKRINSANIKRDEYHLSPEQKTIGKNKKFHIRTYGCQSNVRDGETIKGILTEMGYMWTDDILNADLIILNTCAIRENAEKKVIGEIGLLKQQKIKNPNLLIGMSGCLSQSEKVVNKILEKYSYVDFIFGTHNIHELANIISKSIKNKELVVDVWSKEGDVIEDLPIIRDSNIKAWVNIMYGCDKFCTYCIVPYTRGKIRSRLAVDIINEVNDLKQKGYKEVTLLGQNVNSYGIDLDKQNINFAQLLELVAKTGIERIRFATSNPWNWTNEIIDVCKKYHNIMPYFHLPIQSGNENILKKMNREMKINDYINKINYIREQIPLCAISTDIIVGFPNESEEEFEDTLKLYNQIKYDNAYTFIYSKRENTPAAKMDDKIDLATKKQRLSRLNELVKLYAKQNNEKYIDQVLDVLVEGKSKNNDQKMTGYSPQWKVVNFTGNASIGDIVKVKITSASRFSLNGILVK